MEFVVLFVELGAFHSHVTEALIVDSRGAGLINTAYISLEF